LTKNEELYAMSQALKGMVCLLSVPGIESEEPIVRRELAYILRLAATMLETQQFDDEIAVRGKAFAETLREMYSVRERGVADKVKVKQ
jgi:hypothetical protein